MKNKNENKVKLLAMYLPQYYTFEQNDKWWGKGFTEWTNVKNAKPLFKGHRQPRIPYNSNYYCLKDADSIRWQATLAKEHGIFGWCIYHYWFEGTQMMEIPPEILLENKDIDINFCFSWANHTWTKAPGKKDEQILIRQTYGNESDWEKHYHYLNNFFKDKRYIKVNNKPVLVIYNAVDINCWHAMNKLWDHLAKEDGWDGIYYISTLKSDDDVKALENMDFDAQFEYQPTFGVRRSNILNYGFWYHFKYNVLNLKLYNHITKFDYDRVWKSIINNSYQGDKRTFLGAFNDWDTSIRWGQKGNVTINSSPAKFQKYLENQVKESDLRGNEFLFITAWNEWSEGAYLEPDEDLKYAYLDAVKNALTNVYEK